MCSPAIIGTGRTQDRERGGHAGSEPVVAGDSRARLDCAVDAGPEINGRVAVEASAEISGSRIVGPVLIDAGSKISGSYVRPLTRDSGYAVDDSEIEYSFVRRGVSIRACIGSRHPMAMTWRSPSCSRVRRSLNLEKACLLGRPVLPQSLISSQCALPLTLSLRGLGEQVTHGRALRASQHSKDQLLAKFCTKRNSRQ